MAHKKDDDCTFDMEEESGPGLVHFESTEAPKAEGPIATTSDDAEFFDIVPMKKTCKFCSVEIVTYVEKEVHPLFGLTAIGVVFIFGLLSIIILPFLFLVTQNVVHRCSRCL
jgi:hypothetical protein